MIETPIVFLDLDGVINSESSEELIHDFSIGHTYDPKLCIVLNSLFSEVEVDVVVSSTWRFGRGAYELEKVLETIGVYCNVIGVTPFNGNFHEPRGNEIELWLASHGNPKNFIIIDDDNDMKEDQLSRFIEVDCSVGFTQSNLERSLTLLRNIS